MSGLVALAIAIGLFVWSAPALTVGRLKLSYFTIVGAFVFWYWLPAANLLTVGYVGVSFFQITPSVDAASWIVLACQIACLALLFVFRFLLWHDPEGYGHVESRRALGVPALGAIALASAILFLAVRFASGGAGALLDLVQGQASAREQLDFYNFSTGAGQSLLGLWEVCTIWTAIFAFARHIITRSVLTSYGMCSLAAITLMFVASGTRAVIMQATVVFVLAMLRGIRVPRTNGQRQTSKTLLMLVPVATLATLAASAFASRFDSDAGYRAAGPSAAIIDTFFSNNDMMRELAFVIDTMPSKAYPVIDFLITPFTFMLPSFFGFSKEIPLHLLMYNSLRLNLDMVSGQGNAFPGLVADFWLLFGYWSIILFALFVVGSIVFIYRIGMVSSKRVDYTAYLVTGFSYLFFDFRNITGAFVLVLIFGVALLKMVDRPSYVLKAR